MKLPRVSNQKSERIQLPYHQDRGFLLFSLSWALLNKRFQRSWMCRRRVSCRGRRKVENWMCGHTIVSPNNPASYYGNGYQYLATYLH
ncbi:hypothetical protein MRB53_022281 [Persea americana]|uniref:Uncharacterized protein n=1 Tax=Persea americana TaxID=3435 RepID=A0ACC2L6Q4_PERAE|nr:hypothetical protein MRB53_022281 [Persea americana]